MSALTSIRSLAALLVPLLLGAPRALAQCAVPDGLDGGPCCSLASLSAPRGKFSHECLSICWRDCQVEQVKSYRVKFQELPVGLPGPLGPPCGWFTAKLGIYDGPTQLWRGRLGLAYSRTWVEFSGNTQYQVWRFLANGDLFPTAAAGPIPCPVPPCVPAHSGRARFTGYVDYAYDCANNLFEYSWMLTHACDAIDHDPAFPRGGAFHPDRSYTFVGPAAGFVPGPIQPIEMGTAVKENLRRWQTPMPGAVPVTMCEFEEPIAGASLVPVQTLCECSGASTTQWVESILDVNGTCGTQMRSIPGTQPFLSMGIGAWTDPTVYPGTEILRWNTGVYDYVDSCIGIVQTEYFFGVTTFNGFPAFELDASGIGTTLPPTFVDQVSSKRFPSGASVRNVPFRSDHDLQLNLP